MTLCERWWRFSAGGIYGFFLQTFVLMVLAKRLPLGWATAIAVEAAVFHNFAWHELFTWRERHASGARTLMARAGRFQITNGGISIFGNVLITTFFHHRLGLPVLAANLAAVAICAAFNFIASEWLVFKKEKKRYPEDGRVMFV